MEQGEIEVNEQSATAKCPYLAGRPPHGTYKLCPSNLNVCYGRAQDSKRYSQVSKETQAQHCFGGDVNFGQCPDYQRAEATAIAPPDFGRVVTDTMVGSVHRVRKRRKNGHRRRRISLKAILSALTCLVLLGAAIIVVVLVMRK